MNYWKKINQIQLKLNSLTGLDKKNYANSLLKSNPKIFEELKKNPYYVIDGKFGGLYPWQDFDSFFENYDTIMFLGGRGCGKSSSCCQYIKIWVDSYALPGSEILFVGPTASHWDLMRRANDGFINVFPDYRKPIPFGKNGLKFWNGSYLSFISSEAYDRARSHNSSLVIYDEFCIYDPNYIEDLRAVVGMANRTDCKIGVKELIVSTPKPIRLIGDLMKDPKIKLINAPTSANKHLSSKFIEKIYDQYEGTSLAEQELAGNFIFSDNTYIFREKDIKYDKIENYKCASGVVIAIDPAISNNKQSDETGIVVAKQIVINNKVGMFILEDLSGIYSTIEIKSILHNIRRKYEKCYVTVETNQGGNWVLNYLKEDANLKSIAIESVHAKVGKYCRAELVAPYMEQGRIIFDNSRRFDMLHKQMLNFNKNGGILKDDRMDAFVYAGFSIFNLEQIRGNYNKPAGTDW